MRRQQVGSGVEGHVNNLLMDLLPSEEQQRPGLASTVRNYAKLLQDLTAGYKEQVTLEWYPGAEMDSLVIVPGIPFVALCERYAVPFFGRVHVAYMPNGNLVLTNECVKALVDMYSRRLTSRQLLAANVAEGVFDDGRFIKGALAFVEARHSTEVRTTGIEGSWDAISYTREFDNPQTRAEIFKRLEIISRRSFI